MTVSYLSNVDYLDLHIGVVMCERGGGDGEGSGRERIVKQL